LCAIDAGKSNGVQKGWINGRLALDEKNLKYRKSATAADELIGGLHWHVYHGGKGSDWAPNKNQSIRCVFALCLEHLKASVVVWIEIPVASIFLSKYQLPASRHNCVLLQADRLRD
jgi:hypothetical protein